MVTLGRKITPVYVANYYLASWGKFEKDRAKAMRENVKKSLKKREVILVGGTE